MVRDNIRIPDLVVGDMNAQIAAAQIGAQRFLDLVRRCGRDTVNGAYEDLMDYSERLMRGAIRAIMPPRPGSTVISTILIRGGTTSRSPSPSRLKATNSPSI
jgi:N-methylhydantoinase B/oxoprolinase/acetone carboxylase alpha subunit